MERSGAAPVEWHDINAEPTALAASHGASIDDVRRKLHVIDEAGRAHVGADAFLALWSVTPGQRWLGRLLSNAFLKPGARLLYDWFADRLYAWNRRKGRW